jgi:hypothetical protein
MFSEGGCSDLDSREHRKKESLILFAYEETLPSWLRNLHVRLKEVCVS